MQLQFLAEIEKDVFNDCREPINTLLEELQRMEVFLEERMKDQDMPEQLIHADLHFDNVLYDGEKVTGKSCRANAAWRFQTKASSRGVQRKRTRLSFRFPSLFWISYVAERRPVGHGRRFLGLESFQKFSGIKNQSDRGLCSRVQG